MTRLYLMRHGQVENPHGVFCSEGFSLSETGARQIVQLAHDFRSQNIDVQAVIASPYVRTRETAEIVAQEFKIAEVQLDERLKEWQVGPWFGRTFVEFYAHTKYNQDPPPAMLPPEIEPLDVMAERVMAAMKDWEARYRGRRIVIVSHREPMVSAMLNLEQKSFDEIHRVSFPMGSVWELRFDDTGQFLDAEKRFEASELNASSQ